MQFPNDVQDRHAVNWGMILSIAACLAILALGTWQLQFELVEKTPTSGAFFYKWRLADPTFLSRATAWLGFGAHLLLVWATIWWAVEKSPRQYTQTLRPVNFVALAVNGVFVVLHYLQSAFFYDGTVQDLPSWTAQGTVIMMLFVIMAMENRRRGLFFGKKLPLRKEFYRWLRDYHGYAFSFAVIYTFWIHPMVPTWGHLTGFLHVMLIMLQGSLMFTKVHLNKTWIVTLELIVLPHAALVAIEQGFGLVYMFAFGFLVTFIVTQMHAFRLPRWVTGSVYASFVLTLVLIYGIGDRALFQINEVIRIPAVLYGLLFITYAGWWLFARFTGRLERADSKLLPPDMPAA